MGKGSRRVLKGLQLLLTGLFIAALVYVLGQLRFDAVYQELLGIGKPYLISGVLLLLLAAALKVFRFSRASRYFGHPISLFEAALVEMVGISFAMLTPARIGEASKAVLLNKRGGLPLSNSFGIVIFERFFDVIFLSSGAFLFAVLVLPGEAAIIIGLFLSLALLLFYLFITRFNSLKKLIPQRYSEYFTPLELNHDLPAALLILAVTGASWGFEAGFPWILARSMNTEVSFALVFGAVCISTVAVIFSVLPAGAGTMDLSFLILFPLIGVPAEKALSILLIYRFFGLLIPILSAVLLTGHAKTSLKDIRTSLEEM